MSLYLPAALRQPFQGVLFDLDGTLVDSEALHYAAFKQALLEHGYDLDSLGDTIQYGGSFRKLFLAIAERFHLPDDTFEQIYERKVEITLATPAHTVDILDGAISFLELLKERSVPMGIVTNSEQAYVEHVLSGFDLAQYFDHIVHAEHVTQPKPAPDGYRRGLELLQLPSDHVLAFENTDAGITAAKAAGLKVIAIHSTDPLGTSTYEAAHLSIDHFGDTALDDLLFEGQPR